MRRRLWLTALIIFFMVGAPMRFAKSGEPFRMAKDELKGLLGHSDLVVIDVRYGRDWIESDLKIQGAVREDPKAFDSWADKHPRVAARNGLRPITQ